jgi:SAM-dependent methyltransferase
MEGLPGRVSVERDDGWRDEYAAGLYMNGAQDWAPTTKAALEAVEGRVLDVGAGAGRHARFLSARGCEVVALDNSPGAVEACRRQGLDAVLGAVGDPRLLVKERYDAVLLLGHNLGLLGSAEKAQDILSWLAERCVPGGVLLGDSLDTTISAEPTWRAYNERNRVGGRLPGETRMRVSYGGRHSDWFAYWLVSPRDLEAATRHTSWEVERVDFDEDERFAGDYLATLRRR